MKPVHLFLKPFVYILVSISLFTSCNKKQKVSLVVHHAVIYTVDSAFTIAEAMAIENGKIIATGSNENILKAYYAAEMLDTKGKAIFPGFIDAHCHFTGYAMDGWKCDLTGTKSWEDVLAKISDYSKAAPMLWLYGRGWDQNDWPEKKFPDNHLLDSLFPYRPVYLKRIDGHAVIANSAALKIAGITAATKVDGGSVELLKGKPTGILIDNAMHLVENKIPLISDSLAKAYFTKMQTACFKNGLTGLHDCGISEHTVQLLEEAQKTGDLKIKIFALLTDSVQYYDSWIKKGRYTNGNLTVGGFKLYADGALGSRGACLLQDYSDKPGWRGFLLSKPEWFMQVAQKLATSNLQLCTHAIGDSGNRQILKIYASVLKEKNDKRWRIEHAQVINENDFHFFADYKIIPSVQPTHATSDMYWTNERLGEEREKNSYAYKQLLQTNGWMPLGTDFPVEDISPIKTFFAAVVRKDAKGFPQNGFHFENALSRQEAIRGMTIWAAKAAFQENEKGSLEKGKAADFIILDTDLMQCNENNILNTKVKNVYLNGANVWGIN